jgi:hypothetical protein
MRTDDLRMKRKVERLMERMPDTVISVAHFAKNKEIQDSVLQSDAIRHRTLKICSNIPGYDDLPLNVKNIVYDAIRNIPHNAEITGAECVKRFGSDWINVHYTLSAEDQKKNGLHTPHRVVSIRTHQSEQDKSTLSVISYADTQAHKHKTKANQIER